MLLAEVYLAKQNEHENELWYEIKILTSSTEFALNLKHATQHEIKKATRELSEWYQYALHVDFVLVLFIFFLFLFAFHRAMYKKNVMYQQNLIWMFANLISRSLVEMIKPTSNAIHVFFITYS